MTTHLGIRSPLVQSKIGFDLRPAFDDTLNDPLPPRLRKLADAVDGYADWREVRPAQVCDVALAPRRSGDAEFLRSILAEDDAFRFA